jgi:hypothetical protein
LKSYQSASTSKRPLGTDANAGLAHSYPRITASHPSAKTFACSTANANPFGLTE